MKVPVGRSVVDVDDVSVVVVVVVVVEVSSVVVASVPMLNAFDVAVSSTVRRSVA